MFDKLYIRGFIKFAMFEEQIKMFDENKQQLICPSLPHTQSLLGTAHKSNCSLTLGTDGSGGHTDGQGLITLLSWKASSTFT